MARKYGWVLALGREDISCPLAKAAFGFEPLVEHFTSGCCCEGMYTETATAGAHHAATKWCGAIYGKGDYPPKAVPDRENGHWAHSPRPIYFSLIERKRESYDGGKDAGEVGRMDFRQSL